MKKNLMIVWLGVASLAMFPVAGHAQEQTLQKGIVVVKGTVHIGRDAANAVTSISITTDENKTIEVKLDDKSKEMARIENKRVFATGTMLENVLIMQTWFMTNRK
jgi:hypothetical protein